MSRIVITGAAGFIGMHVARRFLGVGTEVVGIDNMNAYYDVRLKHARLTSLLASAEFEFINANVEDDNVVSRVLDRVRPKCVIHLAAQAGVRYSIENPLVYADSNMRGTTAVFDACVRNGVEHVVYASSSSVYGMRRDVPFSVDDRVDHPVSLYAATKKANELTAHAFSHVHGMATTGLRFFTVYGPWGRPDMAYYRFAEAISAGRPIQLYNGGRMSRDFTFIDDIVEGVIRVATRDLSETRTHSPLGAPYRLYNIGNNHPESLMSLVHELERNLKREAICEYREMQKGDVETTFADVSALERDFGYRPETTFRDGIAKFVEWFLWYQKQTESLPC